MEWIAAAQALVVLLNYLQANRPKPNEEVTQEQLDEANHKMNEAVANWDATP